MADGLFMPSHLIILGLIAALLFGPKRLPEFGRSLGQGLRGFREGLSGSESAASKEVAPEPARQARQQHKGSR